MTEVRWTSAMRRRMAFLSDQYPAKYQEMKDNGTLLRHLQQVSDEWSKVVDETKKHLRRKWETDHNMKINNLQTLANIEVNNFIWQQSLSTADEMTIYEPM